jgi:hypothetical protein
MCFVDQENETPEAGPAGIIPNKQRVVRVFSVTMGIFTVPFFLPMEELSFS